MTVDRSRIVKLAGFVALGLVAACFLAVSAFPIVTNDSLGYLDHSRDVAGEGLVRGGYRQVGYPITLTIGRLVSGLVGVESLLFSALVQRMVLAIALVYAIWLWRWKAAPVAALVLTPSILVYSNFLLTEGLSVPLSLLLACVVGHHFRLAARLGSVREREEADGGQVKVLALAVTGSLIALMLLFLRYPLAVFGIVPVVFLGAAARRRDRHTRSYVVLMIVFILVGGVFSAGLAAENNDEFGVSVPTANGKPAQYWGAWRLTFSGYPDNRADPALAEFWDDGNPHGRLAATASTYPGYPAQADAIDRDIDEMLGLAGLNRKTERFFSVLGALRGGRIDDLNSYTVAAVRSDAGSINGAIYRNTFAIRNGPEAFAEQYNDGVLPLALITPSVLSHFSGPNVRVLLHLLLPLALIGILVLSILKRQWWLGVGYLVPVLVLAMAMGWLLLDNVRFLIPGSAYAIAGLSALWDVQALSSGRRSLGPLRVPGDQN